MGGSEQEWLAAAARHASVAACLLVIAGCSGEIDANGGVLRPGAGAGGAQGGALPGTVPGATRGTAPGTPPGGDPTMPGTPAECAPRVPQRLVLLSDLQHANAVGSALGEAARDPGRQLSADTKPFSQKGLVVS